jgi:ABC-type spermidine/putrescine transport system permease subunit I
MKKNKKNFKKQTFFRSFAISAIIIFSLLTLLLGFFTAYTRIEKQKTGNQINITEIIPFELYF